MLSGLRLIAAEHGVRGIQIVSVDSPPQSELPEAFFAHSRVGANEDPISKVEEFVRRMRGGFPGEPAVAFMKFCYVDFDPYTKVPELFAYYRSTIDQLTKELPAVRLVHATVPLMTRDLSVKNRIRLLLGRTPWRDGANIRRHEFNELLRQSYDPSRIIHIARVESTSPNGAREDFTNHGRQYFSLSPAYTNDGGHLNEGGQRRVAAEMIRVLARNLRQREQKQASSRRSSGERTDPEAAPDTTTGWL
jgi:hypothetical protein